MNGKKGKSEKREIYQSKDDFELTISFKVNNELLTIDINKKLHIPSIDVLTPQKACNMMAENASIHARWNVLSNQAAVNADRMKIEFEIWVKEKSRAYRSDLAEVSSKRITDKQVEEAVMTDPEYLRMYNRYLKAKEEAANLRSIAFGFGERGERLVNIVSMMKSEKSSVGVKNKFDYSDDDDKEDDVKAFSNDEEEDEN
jgi:hypothetical protein